MGNVRMAYEQCLDMPRFHLSYPFEKWRKADENSK